MIQIEGHADNDAADRRQGPQLSIITVVLNDLDGLRRTYDSLKNLNLDYEWIVIDGASSDGTQEWLQTQGRPGMLVVSERDEGIYDAMNKGWRLARGDWVYNLNAGDVLRRNLGEFLTADARVDVISGRVALIDPSGHPMGLTHPTAGTSRDDLGAANCIAHQATILRRDLIDRFGVYSLDFRIQGDFEYWVRLQAAGVRFHFIEEVLADFVYDGVSSQRSNFLCAEAERREVLRRYGLLDSRRAALWGLRAFALFHLKSLARAVLPARVLRQLRF